MPVKWQALATITLDAHASDGSRGRPLHPLQRPVARSSEGASVFDFCGYEPHGHELQPGESMKATVGFHAADARERLPLGQPIPFGTDSITRGTILIAGWMPVSEAKLPEPQALATIAVSAARSNGTPGWPLDSTNRPLVRRVGGDSWYTFVMTDGTSVIEVGETATVEIAFIDQEAARVAFPPGAETVYGNGLTTFGTFVLAK